MLEQYQYDLVQIKPQFMIYGIDWMETYALASAEKALLDCLYLSSRKGKRFYHFPELDLSTVNPRKFKSLLKEHNFSKSIEVFINARFKSLLTS